MGFKKVERFTVGDEIKKDFPFLFFHFLSFFSFFPFFFFLFFL